MRHTQRVASQAKGEEEVTRDKLLALPSGKAVYYPKDALGVVKTAYQ
jgi:hypothetical protein